MRESTALTIKITKDILRDLGYSLEGPLNIPDTIEYNGKTYLVTKIAKNAFRSCRKITSVSIPESVTEIEANAFYRCVKLASMEFRGETPKLQHIRDYAICYTHLTEITLPTSVKTIGRYSIADNTHLLHINLPDSLIKVDDFAFSNCPNMEKITIPNSVATLGTHVFDGCEGLETVNLSCNIKELREGTFTDCWNLTEVILPEGLKNVNLKAFDGCANIRHIKLPRTIEEIRGNSWLWQSCMQYFSYNGSKDDWKDMWAMHNHNRLPLCNIIKCLDGNIRSI